MSSSEISPAAEEQGPSHIDELHYSLQVKQENTQKKTFTSWVNSQLEKHSPPSAVSDLYADIGAGHALLDLLEVLSGEELPREKGSNTFQCRSNIEKALTFLKNRSIKLINIHVADITEGKPSIVLGLIWTIILHFHIEELAWTLACGYNQPPVESLNGAASSPTASPPAKRSTKAKERWKMSAKKALLLWAKEQCALHGSINVTDFKSSWRNGLAFLAVIRALRPDLVDMERAKGRTNKENLKEAFQMAEEELNIPRLLEPEDVDVISPDEKSIMTYVAQFLQHFKNLPMAEEEMQGKVQETLNWLSAREMKLTNLLTETENAPFCKTFQEMLSFMQVFNEEKKAFQPVLALRKNPAELNEDHLRMREAWENLASKVNEWKTRLDLLLPEPLDAIESWLQEVEHQLAEDLPESQDHGKTMAALEGKMRAVQSLMECFPRSLETLQSFKNRDEMGMPVVPPQKLEEMRRRFGNIQFADFNLLVEYHHAFCSAVLEELISRLNIWHVKYGTKETVESLLSDWQSFIEERGFLGQLETVLQACEEKKNKITSVSDLGADPQDASKLFKTLECKISTCKGYISNVNATLRKVLASWDTYSENLHLLKAWLEETRKEHPKKIPTEILTAWNSRHGNLNEAGNFLIETSNQEVGLALSGELKKVNRKWAKLIKKTQFEMRLLRRQEEEMKLAADSHGKASSAAQEAPAHVSEEVEMPFENAETFPVGPKADLPAPEESSSEQEIALCFEDAQKELEASVVKAMQLLSQKASPEGQISECKEAFSILDAKILGKFLKAAERLKGISPASEKAAVEDKSRDVRERWEAVQHEIISYVRLKMEMEIGKLNKAFSKLYKQLDREQNLLSLGITKGLVQEHEAIFSQEGPLGELDTSLQALKAMSEIMTEEENQPEAKMSVAKHEEKRGELQRRAAAVHAVLLSRAAEAHSSKKKHFALTSASREEASSGNSAGVFSVDDRDSGEVPSISLEPERKLQNGRHSTETFGSDGELSFKSDQESYDTARNNLKLHFCSIKEKVFSGFTDDMTDTAFLQNKLHELEALESKSNSSWKLFEDTALKLEKLAGEMEMPVVSEGIREELFKEWNHLWMALNDRMESLKATLAIVLPIENEWILLSDSDKELRKRDVKQCMLTNMDFAYKKLKEMQKSIAKASNQCCRLGQGSRAGGKVLPVDWQAAVLLIGKYKMGFEELGRELQVIKAILQELETFLASLRHAKQHLDICKNLSTTGGRAQQDVTSVEEGDARKEFSLLKERAKYLDERLKQASISLEDAECATKTCCEQLTAALDGKGEPAGGLMEMQGDTQIRELEEKFATKNSELFKNIQDINDKIMKIGLRDPTIPAVQQRSKSLSELRHKLDRYGVEMKALKEMACQVSQGTEAKRDQWSLQWGVTEGLWKQTKLSISERQDQCARAIELLKQYHSCKSRLASIIQKQEHALSQQVSYMGKENLQRIIAKAEVVKIEFNEHSEDVDRISQICKNLQVQLNKMKSFEEPPFENEANAIVDRCLDINERTENYCDQLGRALALWDQLLNLSSSIDGWTGTEHKNLEDQHLTEEEWAELELGLQFQKKRLEEFDRKVDEIQHLLQASEPPLELQVIKSSLLNKMELIRKHLPNQPTPTELNGSTAELKGDLDLAKTQLGMTESLLKALSPSDTLEIFTKLEDIHQKILQQKYHVKLLQKETGYLNPEVNELKKQLKSVTDLFNSKKQIYQDHFTTLLNYQCKDFNDWFRSARLSLKECFDPSETKEILEEKLQRLTSFLTSEGKGNEIQEVKTLLNKVKSSLPKASVSQLSGWVKDQEMELRRLTAKCEAREMELCSALKQLARLEEDLSKLKEWLNVQEDKLQKSPMGKPELEHFYQILLKQRESFDSLPWLVNSLRRSGLSNEGVALESAQLAGKYKAVLGHVRNNLGASQVRSAEEKNFKELAQNILSWVQKLNESVLGLSSEEPQMLLEEKLGQIKEIVLLKDEGEAKLHSLAALGESLKSDGGSKDLVVQQVVADLRNQWECTLRLANEYLRLQEELHQQREQDKQREDDGSAALCELEKLKEQPSVGLQPSLPEMQPLLTNGAQLPQEAEGLTFLLNALQHQHNTLEGCHEDSLAEKSSGTMQQLHESLLSRLQNTAKLLEGHAEEHQRCKELTAHLKELLESAHAGPKQIQPSPLCQTEDTLTEIIALVHSVKQKTSLPEQEKDAKPRPKHKKLRKNKPESAGQEARNIQSDGLQQKPSETQTQEKGAERMAGTLVLSGSPTAAENIRQMEVHEKSQDITPGKSRRGKKADGEATRCRQEGPASEELWPSSILTESDVGPALAAEGLKDSSAGGRNFLNSTSRSRKRLKKSGQTPPEDNLPCEPQPWQLLHQKKMLATNGGLEMPQTALPIINGKGMEADLEAKSVTHQSPESKVSEVGTVFPSEGRRPPETKATVEYTEMEQKVNEVKIQTAELDIVLVNDQLAEIENLCAQLEKQKASALSMQRGGCLTTTETNSSCPPDMVSHWDRLLQESMAIKEAKQHQFHLVNNYQGCLSAVQSTVKRLSVEKENVKTRGLMEDAVLLENIRSCLGSIKKERDLLNKLKLEQERLSPHLTSMDKELTQSQVKQVEQWWDQAESSLQKKQLQVVMEAEEFKRLMDKAKVLEQLLQQQYCLQTGLDVPDGEARTHPALLATELQTLKHRVSLLKRSAEVRMKRIWSDPEKSALEKAINDLQNQLEELEQLTPREEMQITRSHIQAYEIVKRTEEAILWVRISLLHLDEKAALFPDDMSLQIQNCKAVVDAAKDKEPSFTFLVDEAQRITLHLQPNDVSALSTLSLELQTSYQDLVLKLAHRLQQLEFQLGERQKLCADLEKVQTQLRWIERTSISDTGEAGLKPELLSLLAVLEEIPKEVQQIEGLIDSHFKDLPPDLDLFEHLFLSDCLRNLRIRAKRACRLNQIKHCVVENKIGVCGKLSEKIRTLQRELTNLQHDELELDPERLLSGDQEVVCKLHLLKQRALGIQSSLSLLQKCKEIWESLDLKWDVSPLDELQSQLCKMKNDLEKRFKSIDSLAEAYHQAQMPLDEAAAIISTIERDCNEDGYGSTPEASLISAKILSQRIECARVLTQEAHSLLDKNENFGASLKEAKMQEIRSLEVKIDRLQQTIRKKILTLQEKCMHEQDEETRMAHSLLTLKQIKSELRQPCLVDLDLRMIPCEKSYCKALDNVVEVECCAAEDLMAKERGTQGGKSALDGDLKTKLAELRKLKAQLKADIAERMSALDKTQGTAKRYNEAVRKASDVLGRSEALLCSPLLSLDELENSGLPSHGEEGELEAVKAGVEALTSLLERPLKPGAEPQLEKALNDLVARNLAVRDRHLKRKSDVQRCVERYRSFTESKEKIRADLAEVEKTVQKSLDRIPVSYKEALEQLEQSKVLTSRLVSVEEDLTNLRHDSGHLSIMCKGNDRVLIATLVSTLWLKWLRLLEAAKEWEIKCEEQSQEWKSVSEELERETIILDNLQEELPEHSKETEKATKDELQECLECATVYVESVGAEKSLLQLILHRLSSILNVPECPSEKGEGLPVMNELRTMQERLKELHQKAQQQKSVVLSEIQDRAKSSDDIYAVKNSLKDTMSLLQTMEAFTEKAEKLEEIQKAIDSQKQTLEQVMDKLRIKYSEIYTIVPVEIETHLEDCKQTLQDLEEKVNAEVLKNSPHYTMEKKIEDINKGLQAVENMLQQKSENVSKAKEIQKRIWDLLDLWHYKMNELDSEAQDTIEQDPGQAQELMDRLMIPLQQYQQVSQQAERRTAHLNRAASKMEECDELLKSTGVWLENTNRLLTSEVKSDSAKTLNKHADTLQMALEDSEQKQNILRSIYPELDELSALIETNSMVQQLNQVNEQVTTLQRKIMEILPHVQHLADEVEAIESEVKTMEKDVDKIKTILSPSEDTLNFSPKEHLKHSQVILTHIRPMQKALAEMRSYKGSLKLPGMKMQPLSVFQRIKLLLKELKTLEKITREQNELLEPIVKEVEDGEKEIDSLKQLLKSDSDELWTDMPLSIKAASYPEGEKIDHIKQRIALWCQRQEDILTSMKSSLMELHQRPNPPEAEEELSDPEDEGLELQIAQEKGGATDWQPKKRGSLSLLPSLDEEAEDSSFHGEGESSSTPVTNTAERLRNTQGGSEGIADAGRPASEPAEVLHACQAQVAELELWLAQAKESLGSEVQTRQMQQAVERHLTACQVMLLEIEQKVISLLENCKDRRARDNPGLQEEAESLSLKLKDVKCNLEKVQGLLQDKYIEEQINPDEKTPKKPAEPLHFDLPVAFPLPTAGEPVWSRPNGLQELLLKLSEQKNLVDFIDVYVEKMQPQPGKSTTVEPQARSNHENEPFGLSPKDQTGDKWQYLHEELLFKMKPDYGQLAEPQITTKINILPKGAMGSVRFPTVEELKTYTVQLGNLTEEAAAQTQENVTGNISSNLDQKLFELLLAISHCLNNMEQMLSTCVLTSEEAPKQQELYETLAAELQKLHADIGNRKGDLLQSITSAGGSPERFSKCFNNLQAWLQLTQEAAASRGKSVKSELDHCSSYQNEIRLLYDELTERKSTLLQSLNIVSRHTIAEQLQKTGSCELELQNFETQAAKLRDHGERLHLPVALIHEGQKVEDVLDDLWGILLAKERELTSPLISEHQYEALLHGLAEVVALGREKMAGGPKLKATSRLNLQFLLQNHKSFFHKLNIHMLLVRMCSKKVAPSVLQKKEKFWMGLVQEIESLEQQAVEYGARLKKMLQDWIEFDEACMSCNQKLEMLSSAVPAVGLVEETEERVMERIKHLQQIKQNIEEEQVGYHQTMKEGKDLMALVSCSELTRHIGKLEERWMSLSQKVDHELQRLQTLLKLLLSYHRDSKELERWLEPARQRVNDWNEQSLNASQDLDTIRRNIQSLLAFSKETDDKSSLKSSVISTGHQLLLIKEADAAKLRSFLKELEQQWTDLIAELPSIQEKFHQLQMTMLPSQEAITELFTWMNHVDQQRRNEASINSKSTVCQVKALLKTCKEYLLEMNFKQWTVDYVNQSLLQMTTYNVESIRYERNAFAERLGEMNLQWHRLHGSLNKKMKELEVLLESVTENENRAQSVGSWLEVQGERLKLLEKPASFILAEGTGEDCKALENQLAVKSADVAQLKTNCLALGDCAENLVSRINHLDDMRTSVVSQVAQLKTSTQSALEQWKIYDNAWDEVKLMLARVFYILEHSKPSVVTLETLRSQVESLQPLQENVEGNEEKWAKLQAAAANLKKLCSPSCSKMIEQKYQEAYGRWNLANEGIGEQLQKAQASLRLWESYVSLHAEATEKLDHHEEQCSSLWADNTPTGRTVDSLKQKAQEVKKLQLGLQSIKGSFLQASELADKTAQLAEPAAESLLQEKLHPLQRISCLEKMLQMKTNEFQRHLSQLEDFETSLKKLENRVKESVTLLDNLNKDERDSNPLMNQMLELTALSPEMESLNEASFQLPLSDFAANRLQSLNRLWSQKTALALEQCSDLQGIQLDEQKFLQKCQSWVQFLEKMKECLKGNVAGTLEKLQEQQKDYERLQAEMSVNQHIFDSIMSKALRSLESGEAESRNEFISKLALLKEQWQSVVRMAQQRKGEIDSRVKQWQKFRASVQDLSKFLLDTNSFVAAVKSQDKYSLHRLRNLRHDFKLKGILLQRWQARYSLTLDIGEKLVGTTDPEAKAVISMEISQLQENWNSTQLQVEKIIKQLQGTMQTWNTCEQKIKELRCSLQELKMRTEDPLPAEHDKLQIAKDQIKELEKSLGSWNQTAKELSNLKTDLAHDILAEDAMVLKEQVEHLHRQWEELCLRVSLRKQELEDRLSAWAVFSEKNKELCAWLVQMESKVLQSVDVSIEDMIDKLQKDCMEEINLFSENKLAHLKQMGEQLIKASNKSQVAEIDEKVHKISDHRQHLFDIIGGRVKKLKETFAFIQQLDKNMSNLRTWLARIESELSKPVVYDICDDQEIQKRLAEQQDLQRDIEQHSAGVESVFNICEVLLHDSDACANDTECDSIQQTTRSLDRRWRNICAMSMERRMKIEETWRLWQKFLEDYSRFEDWLKTAERTASGPNSSEVSYTNAKQELKKFEAFQRQIHERLTQLELINKQYRRLARENRTDSASKLKQMVHEGNQRWDNLQKRVTAILRRLKHFTSQWEEFVGAKDSILVWLTEMDLQLTNVEHFSESNLDDKMRQLNGFQQEIALNTTKIDQLIVFGEHLILKSEPSDAVVIEEELEELHKYCQDVFGRVARFHQRLTSWHPGLEDEKETSENEAEAEDSRGMQNDLWHKKVMRELPASQQSLCHLMPPATGHERSGCETPVSVDSIPLEWDHTGDVGGSSSPEDEEEEPYYSAVSDVEIPENPEAYHKMTTNALQASSGKSASESHGWHSPDGSGSACRKHLYHREEMVRNVLSKTPETSTPYKPVYVKQLSSDSLDSVKERSRILPGEANQGSQTPDGAAALEKQPGVLERWELLQAQHLSNKLSMKQNLHQWEQLNSDLSSVSTWLDDVEEELEESLEEEPGTSIQALEQRAKKLKDMLKAFDNYKALVMSINLTSKDFNKADSTESKELQNRLRRVNLRWEKANILMGKWRKSLQEDTMLCQDFHELNQKLLLWLAGAETRRYQAQVKDPNADPLAIQESRKELMQLEKELLEQQLQVNTLQEISTHLLVKSGGGDYAEAAEKVHVIGKKLKQLLEGVSNDLKASQGTQDVSASYLPDAEGLDSGGYHQLPETRSTANEIDRRKTLGSNSNIRTEDGDEVSPATPKTTLFFRRVLLAALPLQLLFLLLLLLAAMVPSSEEDFSCTHANNFARSFYPMLRYTNGPPPT